MGKETKMKILQMLNDGLYPAKIANLLKLTPATVSGHLSRLKAKHYIQEISYSSSKDIKLTEQGLAFLLKGLAFHQPVAHKANPQTLRIHSLAIAFALRSPLEPEQPAMILQAKGLMTNKSGLENQNSAYAQGLLLTPSSMILYLPELEVDIHEDPRLAMQPLILGAIERAERYEIDLELPLKRLRKHCLAGRIVLQHNANTDNSIAKTVLDKLNKFEVRDELGRVRLIVDHSDGIPEFEAVNAQNAIEDITKAQDFYLALIQNRFDYREEQKARHELMAIAKVQGEFAIKHNALIDTINERERLAIERDNAIIAMLESLSGRRARKIGSLLDKNQRRFK